MFILDTNILSELLKPQPDAAVVAWLAAQNGLVVYTSVITVAEIRFGLLIMPAGKRRTELMQQTDAMFAEDFAGRVLGFDEKAARHYAEIAAERRAAGRGISQSDAMIAAIARTNEMAVITRNIKDFDGLKLQLVDPFEAG